MLKKMYGLLERAEGERESGNFKEALPLYKKAVRLNGSFQAFSGLAGCLRLTGDFKGAIAAYKTALKRSICDEDQKADAFMGLGMASRGLSEYADAGSYFSKAARSYRAAGDWAGFAYYCWCQGGLRRITGNLLGSKELFRLSAKYYGLLKDESGKAYALAGLGGILRMLGDFRQSFNCYERAASIFKKQGDRFGFAYCNCGMGSASRMLFKPAKSEAFYKIALLNYRGIKDEVNIAFVLWGYANTLLLSGRLTEAKRRHRESSGLFLKHKDKRGMIYALLQEGEMDRETGNILKGARCFRAAGIRAKALGLKFEALHAQTGLFFCKKAKSPYKQYAKLGSKWHRVLKRNTAVILDFP